MPLYTKHKTTLMKNSRHHNNTNNKWTQTLMKYLWKCLQMAYKNNDVTGTHAIKHWHWHFCFQPQLHLWPHTLNYNKMITSANMKEIKIYSHILQYCWVTDIELHLYMVHNTSLHKRNINCTFQIEWNKILNCTLIVHYTYINLHSMNESKKKRKKERTKEKCLFLY